MARRDLVVLGLVAALLIVGVGAKRMKLEDRWTASKLPSDTFKRVLVVGITDNRQARGQFEDLFVSHLRGKNVEGVTSRTIVPDLMDMDESDMIVEIIRDQKIDGAISVRLAYLKGSSEEEWSSTFTAWTAGDQTLRDLIDETLPIDRKKGKIGVEVSLWDTEDGKRLWSARTEPLSQKSLDGATPVFVQEVMDALYRADLL
jgi:hypothetical protein